MLFYHNSQKTITVAKGVTNMPTVEKAENWHLLAEQIALCERLIAYGK